MRSYLILLILIFLTAESVRSQIDINENNERLDSAARIKGIQKVSNNVGFVYTSDAIYRSSDNGSSWQRLPLPVGETAVVSGIWFSNERRGWVILYSATFSEVTLVETSDGGNSWQLRRTSAHKFGEQAQLESAVLRGSAGSLFATFPLATSSNFVGEAVFRSRDGGGSWIQIDRAVELRRSDEPRAIMSGDWSVIADGNCFSEKSECVQETALIDENGRDLTPPEIKDATHLLRNRALVFSGERFLLLPPGGSVRTSLNRGFDKCTAATVAQMQTWWNNSPHYDSNIYISGRNRGCSQPQLNAAWVNSVSSMGWGLIPTIVGYQSPCSVCSSCVKHSSDAATAETQGRGEADIAVTDAANLGLTTGSILYYDMERYDETAQTPNCRVATTAFLKGWTERIVELGYRSGTYGSPRNAIDDWQFMPAQSRMEAVWMARWDNVPSVWTYVSFSNFPTNVWNDHQRIKQWQAPHDETWGGVTFNIDGNIADGPVAGVAVPKNKNADFDGDRRTDVSVFRPSNGVWYVVNSSDSSYAFTAFGLGTDIPTPGDFDGDGRTDRAVFRPTDGVWHLLTKAGIYTARAFGQNGDIPAAGDFNGDGKSDIAVFRPSNGVWYIANSDSLGTYTYISWGTAGDKPVVGDYDADGKSDVAVYRPSNGVWYVLRSSNGSFLITQFGVSTDLPAQGDMDGDGKTDLVVFRPSNGVWYILRSSDAGVNYASWGISDDLPVTGDYDGDGKDDVSVFRPLDGVWYVSKSSGGFSAAPWGLAGDVPIPNAYLPD